ncbi:MAG TPA: hypothetical protein VIX81_10630 [Gammaproteobacteria bacterium]
MKRAEARFWRRCAWLLGTLLAACVVLNTLDPGAVPHQLTLLLCGALVALGSGHAIVNPATSLVRLPVAAEARFRRGQHLLGLAISAVLLLLLLLTPLGDTALPWLLAPLILLPYALLVRAAIVG